MRIALVSREFAPFHGSGVGVYAAEAARAWTAAGHEVHVLTGDHPGLSEGAAALFPGVRVHSLDLQDGMAERLPEPRGAIQWPLGVLERLTDLHARTPFVFGSSENVMRVASYYDLPDHEISPLFGKRGLFSG